MSIVVAIIFTIADIGVIGNLVAYEYIGFYNWFEFVGTIVLVTALMIFAAMMCRWFVTKGSYKEIGNISKSDMYKIFKYIEVHRLDSRIIGGTDDRDSLSNFPCIGSILEMWNLWDGLLNGDCCVELTHDLKYLNIYNVKKEDKDRIKIDKVCTNKFYDELDVKDMYVEFTLDEVKLYDRSLVNNTVIAREN